jgi:hypothetical protein
LLLHPQKTLKRLFKLNEGLIGQAAWEQNKLFLLTDDQIFVTSCDAQPKSI